jgi:regulator of replication initiation timing
VIKELESEIAMLKDALDRSDKKVEENRHLHYENHKLNQVRRGRLLSWGGTKFTFST